MFSKIFDAIKSLFASVFGGGKKEPQEPQKPRQRPDVPEDTKLPQDAAEITADTVVIVTNEMDAIIMPPGPDKDEDFDKDIFDEPKKEEPAPPKVEDKPTKPAEKPADKPAEPAKPVEKPAKKSRYLWCLDNGHGNKTPGKRSPVFEFDGKEDRLFEYEFNRDIVKRIIERLEKEGISYFNVVPEVDIDDFLQGRVDRANNKKSDLPKLYVSIHSNAAPAKDINSWGADSASGIETWHHANSSKGQKMAGIFQKHLIEKTGFKNRHLKTTEQVGLFVLRKTNMPSILTENGFYNNRLEVRELMKPEVRQKIADAHVEAILEIERNGL